ncbi:MAG: bifunctional ornithine acetyltransferase/N-acetylglutamate synthase, partial [Planctomycetales bacterium]|nr:bifunctional ornithine acetyltransferase/N-acetylglutamate synthase [Planctomycetales bacterium]
MSDQIPLGFQFAGVYCGIKRDTSRLDLSLIVADRPCVAAGVYTQNQVVAAPVLLDRERTPSDSIRAIVTNSGNANACTGELGLQNAREMARLTADAIGSQPEEV